MNQNWCELLQAERDQDYFRCLMAFLDQKKKDNHIFYPPLSQVFAALDYTSYESTRVVIVGQDPYHGPGQANGLAFSVSPGTPLPPSLKNIFVELERDLGVPKPTHGSLESWAKQGVLLLNTTLTVGKGRAGSHQKLGWERFTDKVLHQVWKKKDPVIFLLWGAAAQKKLEFLTPEDAGADHVVLKTSHPSPLSAYRGFLGCGHFGKVNQLLESWKQSGIDWTI